jgi:glutaredoxin
MTPAIEGRSALRVYWQPGCTSCLRAKEFLEANGIPYVSVNVRTSATAAAELAELGVRTVPIVARGRDYVLAQDIDELAHFVGMAVSRTRLAPDELVARLHALLAASESLLAAMPAARLHDSLPQRERTWLDLGFHVAMIVQGLITAGTGGELAYEIYERRAPESWRTAGPAIEFSQATRRGLASWWQRARRRPNAPVRTYFGERPLESVLERSAWHAGQHCRQLDYLVHEVARVADAPRLPASVLRGLPVPASVWDREVVPGDSLPIS